jgi:hypothetical protein
MRSGANSAILALFGVDFKRLAAAAAPYLKRVRGDLRQEILAEAICEAWAHREEFNPVETQILVWFSGYVLQVKWRLESRRRSRVGALDRLEKILNTEDPEFAAEATQAAEQVEASLVGEEREAANLLLAGESIKRVASAVHLTRGHVRSVQKRLRQLTDLQSTTSSVLADPRRERSSDNDTRKPAKIDHDIEHLLRGPKLGTKDCPVCHACCYFEHVQPAKGFRFRRLADPILRRAVLRPAVRKRRIANSKEP